MAITIGGLKQKDALRQLGITRVTMSRYRKHPHWPGDDAPWEIIRAFVSTVKSSRGRRKAAGKDDHRQDLDNHGPARPAADDARVAMDGVQAEELSELQAMLGLDDELKRTIIEKNKAQIKAYQEKCMEEYRTELTEKMTAALLVVFQELQEMDLTRAQLENVRKAIHSAREKIMRGGGDYQPELI